MVAIQHIPFNIEQPMDISTMISKVAVKAAVNRVEVQKHSAVAVGRGAYSRMRSIQCRTGSI